MKKVIFTSVIAMVLAFSSNAFAEDKIIYGEAGQQAILSDRSAVTVFRDTTIKIGGQIGAYIDSAELETKGYDKVEWYYLKGIGIKAVVIETFKYDLKLPAYISENEERSLETVKLTENGGLSGIFVTHGVNIRVTVKDASHAEVEIVE
jgi:hypothetical protein